MKVSVKQIYTSVACNRNPEIVDWNKEGVICFGATNAVVIYNTLEKNKDPITTLSHHKSKVNSVKWLHKDGVCTELLSCSVDKTAAVWTLEGEQWKVSSCLSGHEEGVNCIFGHYINENLVVYTGSIDSTIRIWERVDGVTTQKQVINLNSGLCLTLHASLLPSTNQPILFCALDDHKIHVFTKTIEYHRVHTLVGHEDWVRGLDALGVDNDTLMLASASQDTYIRLWRIQRHIDQECGGVKVEQKIFQAYEKNWSVKLDAVLAGHEGWVYGVQWQEKKGDNDKPNYRILSSSLDKTLIIWNQDKLGGAWLEKVRVGEVGGNGLGFYGSRFGTNAILGHGYNGSLHIWRENEKTKLWTPTVVIGGHFGGVMDFRWEGQGRYLVSVGADQTTRLHAPWKRPDGGIEWHELARPQVHGYDMASVALVGPSTLVSAAEEKVVRVFTAPYIFLHNYHSVVGEALAKVEDSCPEGASVPSLGLSNKAVFGDEVLTANDTDGHFIPVELCVPPTEETLMQNTLWPEMHKLYAHGYELHALDASADGQLLASACRATSAEHAAPVLWDTTNWQQLQKLMSHQLTVTQLAFSPDSQRLLTVSRDRRWTLFKRQQGSNTFEVEAFTDKTNGIHTRIIWCCAWSDDSKVFATGSRDGKVCVWSRTDASSDTTLRCYGLLGETLEVAKESVTAVAFAPARATPYTVAVGFDSGRIRLYDFDGAWSLRTELDNSMAHHMTVKRLFFRPKTEKRPETWLASCGADNLVRIYAVVL